MKHAKKAFLASLLATLLCVTMLIGTTFAWFTDSVTSSGNIIKSGTLKVGLDYYDDGAATPEWKDASTSPIFNYRQSTWCSLTVRMAFHSRFSHQCTVRSCTS